MPTVFNERIRKRRIKTEPKAWIVLALLIALPVIEWMLWGVKW